MDKKNTFAGKGKVILRLWNYIYEYKWLFALAIVLTVTSNVLTLIMPKLSGKAIEAIEPGKDAVDFQTVVYYCALMTVLCVVSAGLSYLLSKLMINISQKIVYKMRKEVFNKLLELPVGYFDRFQTGDIISRITYDIDTINASLSNDLLQICTSAITVLVSLIMMITISPLLVLIFLVTIPISIVFTRYMSKKVRPLFRKRSEKLGELNGFAEEMITGQKTIKAYHREEVMIGRFDQKNEEAVTAYYNADYNGSIVGPSVNFINNLSLSLISVFGTILYLSGSISLGNISSFVLYSRKFSGPINEAANIISELQSSLAAAERVFRLMDETPEPADAPDAIEFKDVKGDVALKNIYFSYIPGKPVIKNLSLNADRGSLIAIVGHTGAGKTTLINLLMRFYDPDSGVITLDGVDIQKATRKSLRLSYAMVLQDTWLFNGTVFENVAYGKKDATLDDVIRVCKAAKIHNFITSLPNGYDTVLSDDGINISGGQKQLLTIARAMLLDAKMLILDEATSNVDTRTELQIQNAMRELMTGKTCFVIAHRLSTIQNADTILVVQDGNVVEQGDHASLLAKNGVYAELYYSQYQSY
ncbi:MAG TPA: ABC transporter ATP-binding protein [Bacillota bacterium]|nr:ABC transporter ATP-binding protein [Bacillota bacterium]HOK69005.1 ABC transporter ATP-binding protein [Bacillota bacterium]